MKPPLTGGGEVLAFNPCAGMGRIRMPITTGPDSDYERHGGAARAIGLEHFRAESVPAPLAADPGL